MFASIFKVLSEVARQQVIFAHIDQTDYGLRTITLDMCKKQAGGKLAICFTCTKYTLNSFRLWGLYPFPGW